MPLRVHYHPGDCDGDGERLNRLAQVVVGELDVPAVAIVQSVSRQTRFRSDHNERRR